MPRKCFGDSAGIIVQAVDFRILVSEFKLQLPNYVHFRKNTHEKGMNPLIFRAIGLNNTTTFFFQEEWIWH